MERMSLENTDIMPGICRYREIELLAMTDLAQPHLVQPPHDESFRDYVLSEVVSRFTDISKNRGWAVVYLNATTMIRHKHVEFYGNCVRVNPTE